ncbi:MAG: CotH kinase family protein [Clostridiales bacterium]|nr:CotH kinase family protein [Clostridiales bacterium]
MARRITALVLMIVLAVSCMGDAVTVNADATLTHGTSDTLITEDMLDTEVPSDYTVNESMQADASEGLYDAYFLKDGIQTVEIELDENNLNYLLQNAADKPSVLTQSVTIGGETIYYTGFKTKGNYTLEHSVTDNAGSDRFSFTINFGKYVKKKDYGVTQNFYGCSKISFNNFYFDKSMLKEYMALSLMAEMGVPTPQYGLAKLYINGEYYGVYFMVEAYDTSILEQYYGVDDDELSSYLTKPEETTFIYDELLEDNSALWEFDEEVYADVEDMLPTVMEWVRKLNLLSEGTDFDGNEIDVNSREYLELLGEIFDIDEVVRYFATHSFLCQMDNMFMTYQNFGLYVDTDGKAILIPWDYDLSFGCYYPSDSETTANYNIDVMFSSSDAANLTIEEICEYYEDYPLFHVVYQNEYLRELYHTYMEDCAKIMALGGTTSAGVGEAETLDPEFAAIVRESAVGGTILGNKTYNPGYFNSFIDALKKDITEAASEELADNVYYMNQTNQPSDVKKAFSNLGKIMAMRSLGVMAQVEGWDLTVCGSGCDLSTLGNAVSGWTSTGGILAAIDYATGIYTIADYGSSGGNGNGGWGAPGDNARSSGSGTSPTLSVSEMLKTDTYYQNIAEEAGVRDGEDSLVVYKFTTTGTPEGDYTVSIPLASYYEECGGEVTLYAYNGSEMTELDASVDDNIYTVTVSSLKYIAVVQTGGYAAYAEVNPDNESTESDYAGTDINDNQQENTESGSGFVMSDEMIKQLIMFAAAVIAAVIVVFALKNRQRKNKNEREAEEG